LNSDSNLDAFAAGLAIDEASTSGGVQDYDGGIISRYNGTEYEDIDVAATSGAFSSTRRNLGRAAGDVASPRVTVGDRELREPGRVTTVGVTADVIEFFIGTEGLVIAPTMSRLPRLPPTAVLRVWESRVEIRAQGLRGCVAALRADLERITNALDALAAAAAAAGAPAGTAGPKVYIGYVAALEATASVGNAQEGMVVQMTHAREVGGDLNFDDVIGDDFEAAVAFGPNGFMDEKYAASRIGTAVYEPVFGCTAASDIPIIRTMIEQERERESNRADAGAPSDDDYAQARDIIAAFTHPAACGHSCADEGADAGGYDEFINIARVAACVAELWNISGAAAPDVFDRLRARAHTHATDLWRGSPAYWRTSPDGLTPLRDDDLRDGDETVYTGVAREEIPAGFYSESFPDPDTGDLTTMRYHDEFTDDEAAFLRTRTRDLAAVRRGQLGRRGFIQPM
jgi:hypothetical protein